VPGREELASELAALLPHNTRAVFDPEATELAESLDLESTPFALEIERGTITKKAHLFGGASALMQFMESGGAQAQKSGLLEVTNRETIEGR
jgi:hypothetical protein